MLELFTWLTHLLYTQPIWSISAAFIWGVLSVILSPCHLASVPLLINFVGNNNQGSSLKSMRLSLWFALGILLTMLLIGFITSYLGMMLGDLGTVGKWIGVALFGVTGLMLLNVFSMPQLSHKRLDVLRLAGDKGALMLGVLFGTVLGSCAFAFFMPILGLAFNVADNQWWFAYALILAYALGHSLPIVAAGYSAVWINRLLRAGSQSWMLWWRYGLGMVMIGIAVWLMVK